MTIVDWVASDTASWIFSALGLLATALLVAGDRGWSYGRRGWISSLLPAVVGVLLAVGGTVLVGLQMGRLSWLIALSGVACLLAFAFQRVETASSRQVDWVLQLHRQQMLDQVSRRIDRKFSEMLGAAELFDSPRRRQAQPFSPEEIAESMVQHLRRQGALLLTSDIVDTFELWGSPRRGQAQPFSPEEIAESVVQHLRRQGALRPTTAELVETLYQHMIGKGLLPSQAEIAEGKYRTRDRIDKPGGYFADFADAMVSAGLWAPVSIYTSADDGADLKDAVLTVLREFGLEPAVEEPHVRGSWFQRLWARGRDVAESTPMRERLAKLERALELEALGKRQAEIDKTKAEAVSALLEVVKDQKNAIVRLGSIIVIKTEGDLVVWTIGEMEAADLEKNSALLRDPVAALKFLRGSEEHKPASLDPPRDGDALRG